MKVFVPRILTGVLACLIVAQTVQAQTYPPLESTPDGTVVPEPVASPPIITDAPGQVSVQNYFGYTEVDRAFDPLLRVDTRGGSLMGQDGFTRVSGFTPYWLDTDSLVFVDLGGFATYRPSGGANVGVGWRWYFDDLDRIFGVNAWYDFDAGHVDQYHQAGVGIESLGRYIDYRVNGYIPFAGTSNVISNGIITGGNPKFLDHFIYLDRYYRHETAYRGFDAEMGGPVPFLGKYGLSAYAGGYFFTGLNVGNITGVTARLTGQVNEDLTVGAQFSHDNVFDNNVQIQVTWTIPDGGAGRWFRQPTVRDRMTSSVLRNYRIVANDEVVVVSEKAINPIDNLPYFIAHVDPNRTPGTGDGTVENPYAEISQFDNLAFPDKSAYDIIYVSPRLDTLNPTAQLDTGVTLLSDQRLLSTSVPHQFEVIPAQADVTGNTMFDLPGFVAGPLPILSNVNGGDVVTFTTGAHNMEVSGFEIVGSATGSGIAGVNNTKVNINRNEIHSGVNGITLTNLSGAGFDPETGTTVFTRPGDGSTIDGNSIHDNLGHGASIINNPGAGPLDIQVTNNEFYITDHLLLPTALDGLHIEAHSTEIRGLIDSNTTQVELVTPGGGMVRHGIFLSVDNGLLDFFTLAENRGISNNTLNFNGGDGLHIESTGDSTVLMRIVSNEFGNSDIFSSSNDGFGVYFSANGGNATMQIGGVDPADGNSFFSNLLGAIRYDLSGDNITQTEITNNSIVVPLLDFSDLEGLFDEFTLAANDDDSTGLVPIGFDANFFGVQFSDLYVNNNGNVTLNGPLFDFTPFPIVTNGLPMIAPFFADVDTRSGNVVTYGTELINGRRVFGVNWDDVRHFDASGGGTAGLPTNSFQLLLVDRSDTGAGNFDIIFNYDSILWEAGEASGSDENGLGGESARVGYTNGVNQSFELPGSGVNGALLNSGPAATSLVQNSINSTIPGQYIFEARNGQVSQGTIGDADGIEINLSDTAQLVNSVISQNEIVGNPGYGIKVAAGGNSQVTNLLIDDNFINGNGGGVRLQASDNALIDAILTNNTISGSVGSGLEVASTSGNANAITIQSADNEYSNNNEHGVDLLISGSGVATFESNRDLFDGNNEDGFHAQSADSSQVTITLNNATAVNNGLNGVEFTSTAFSIMNVTVASPTDPLFEGTGTNISNNGANGIAANSQQNSQMFITAFGNNTLVTANQEDGIHLERFDASLFIADFSNMLISGNEDDGMQFDSEGGAPSDPNQPFPGTANQLFLTQIQLNENGSLGAQNGGNGLELNTYADSVIVVNALNSTFNANTDDGIRAFSGDNSSLGEIGNRSVFDNVEVRNNGLSGVHLMAAGNNTQKSRMFVEFNSNSGDTTVSDNNLNGFHISVPYGLADVLIQGDTVGPANFQTRIQRNGGDGIQINVADIAREDDGDPTVVDPDRASDLEMLAYEFSNDQLLNLEAIDVFNGIGTLTVQNVTIGDFDPNDSLSDGNGRNGINAYVGNSELYIQSAVEAGLTVTAFNNIAGELNLNVDQTIVQGNGQRGITVDSQGIHTYAGAAFFFPISPQGNLVNANITNSLIANNVRDGINFDIDGLHGQSVITSLQNGVIQRVSQNEILIENNVIQNNGGSGVRFETNTGEMLRFDYTLISGVITSSFPSQFWGIYFPDPAVVPGNGTVFNPFAIGSENWTFYQAGFFSGIDLDNYLNVLTDNNSDMRFYNNTVQFNGVAENGTASGLNIRLSTNSYLSLDVGGAAGSGQGNFFSGNIGSDVKIRSYTAQDANGNPIQPGASASADDTAAPPTFDHIFLDDTAQLDLRFNNNTGRTLDTLFNPPSGPLNNAGYNNNDPNKGGGGFRSTQIYQVDDGLNLNANNNWTQDIESLFQNSGNFWLRTVADPAFPNPTYPENWNSDNADPFLP